MNSDLDSHSIGLSSTSHLQAMSELVQEPKDPLHLDQDPCSPLGGHHLVEAELRSWSFGLDYRNLGHSG